MACIAVVLAVGLGTRMKSRLPKVLHPVLGDPSLLWVLRSLPAEVDRALAVVHHGKDLVMERLATWMAAGSCPVRRKLWTRARRSERVMPSRPAAPASTGWAPRGCSS